MDTKETTKEREEGVNGEVENAGDKYPADEKPASGCCGGKANKQKDEMDCEGGVRV